MQKVPVQPLTGELRSHLPHSTAKQENIKTNKNNSKETQPNFLNGQNGWICTSPYRWKINERNRLNITIITAAAKSLQSCLSLCAPIDGSPPSLVNYILKPQYGVSLKNKRASWWSSTTPGLISGENHNLKSCMYPSVYSSTSYNSWDMEAA